MPVTFPPEFIFGTATSCYQIEGATTEDGRGVSIWDTFAHEPGRTLGGATGDVACDHYHRYESDFDLIRDYGLRMYRFSLSWPRIQPTGTGPLNQAGLDFYDRLVDALLERGIQPMCTLHHWDLPQPLEDAGGWPVRETAERFAEFASIAGRLLGDRVPLWSPINEPWCQAYLGYLTGQHAPGRRSLPDALAAVHHLNLGHGLAVAALRAEIAPSAQVILTDNLTTVLPASDSAADLAAARAMTVMDNEIFTHPTLKGSYPDEVFALTAAATDWSFVRDGDLELIHQRVDGLGLNWYTPKTVKAGQPSPEMYDLPVEAAAVDAPVTDMDWSIVPSALTKLLVDLAAEFPGLPIMLTENGCAVDDPVVDGRVHDTRRIAYLHEHLTAVRKAMDAGVPVTGYLVWTLLDNYEWSFGYSKRFGITHVDFDTLERTPKDSAFWLAELARTHELPPVPQPG